MYTYGDVLYRVWVSGAWGSGFGAQALEIRVWGLV